jgi:hypothetical protein
MITTAPKPHSNRVPKPSAKHSRAHQAMSQAPKAFFKFANLGNNFLQASNIQTIHLLH